jgi:hypothetical protein
MAHDDDDEHAAEIVALNMAVDALQVEVARLRAQLPAPEWMPLKAACYDCGCNYETVRGWCASGVIEVHRQGGRWYVNLTSLKARLRRIARGAEHDDPFRDEPPSARIAAL